MTLFRHPTAVCMTYWQHARFSLELALSLGVASLAAVAHAVWPDAFVTHTSDTLVRLRRRMKEVGCRGEEVHRANGVAKIDSAV